MITKTKIKRNKNKTKQKQNETKIKRNKNICNNIIQFLIINYIILIRYNAKFFIYNI